MIFSRFSEPITLHPSFSLPSRAILSPLEGIMNRDFFFDAACSLGLLDSWMPPFLGVSRGAVPSVGKLRKRFARFLDSALPLTVQLLGNDADSLAETALRLAECGVRSVNLNFACPSRTVVRSGSGGALLRDVRHTGEIAAALCRRVPQICVSVKLRSGFSCAGESGELIRRLCGAGVSWILFHFRTVSENYAFVGRDEAFRRIGMAVQAAGAVPVFGNGDILTAEDAGRMREASGCAGVAVGRGFLKNPFLLREICGACPDENARRLFLETLFRKAVSGSGRRKYDFYLECVRMACGADSEEFQEALRRK